MPDIVNGLYEILGGLFIMLSCRKLYHDKTVKGVSFIHVFYFLTWGYWNLYFYSYVGATFSFYGSIGIAIANTIWAIMILWYRRKR